LDYWPFVCVKVHKSWQEFLASFDSWPEPKRLVAFSKFARQHYAVDETYRRGDTLLFGAETHGLPDGVCLLWHQMPVMTACAFTAVIAVA
jgi:tRNA (cytidine/uridine-2'-O-)-methyltransferase